MSFFKNVMRVSFGINHIVFFKLGKFSAHKKWQIDDTH